MKKKTILFGSIFACFLMLMIPTISAVESISFRNNDPNYNEEELIQAIINRIEELQESNPNPKMCWGGSDPDGPFEGGLDDRYDWDNLITAFFLTIYSGILLKDLTSLINIFSIRNVLKIVDHLLQIGIASTGSIIGFADAFDIIDPNEDGY